MRVVCLLSVCLTGLVTQAVTWAGDDTQFTLVVSRRFAMITGRAVNYNVYVNDKFLGGVPNGTRLRFAVPVNDTGKYSLRIKTLTSLFGGATQDFVANAGEEVVVDCGHGTQGNMIDATSIFSVTTYPLGASKLHVVPPRTGMLLTINDKEYLIDTAQELTTSERTPINRTLRLKVRAQHSGHDEAFLMFARPGKTCWLDFSQNHSSTDTSLLRSAQFLMQLRLCILYHLGSDQNDLGASIKKMEADFASLHSELVAAEFLDFRDAHIEYFRKVNEETSKSALGIAANNLLCAALWCTVNAVVTQSVPSQLEVLGRSLGAALQTAYELYNLNSTLSGLNGAFQKKEAQVYSSLKQSIQRSAVVSRHELVKEFLSTDSLNGAAKVQHLSLLEEVEGEVAFESGDYAGAAQSWRQGVVNDPQNPVLRMRLGQALFATGDYKDAAAVTQEAMSQLPKDKWGDVVANSRDLYGDYKDYTKQLRVLEATARNKPDDPELRFLLAYHYGYLGYHQQSIDQLNKTLSLLPNSEMSKQLRDEMQAKLQKSHDKR